MTSTQTTKSRDKRLEDKIEEAKVDYSNLEDKGSFLPDYGDLYEAEYVDGSLEVNGIVVDKNPTKYPADRIYVRDPFGDCNIVYFQKPSLRNPIAWTSYKVHSLDNTLLSATYMPLASFNLWFGLSYYMSSLSIYAYLIFVTLAIILPFTLFGGTLFAKPLITPDMRPFPLERIFYKIKDFF